MTIGAMIEEIMLVYPRWTSLYYRREDEICAIYYRMLPKIQEYKKELKSKKPKEIYTQLTIWDLMKGDING